MKPILYKSTETNFADNGIGVLSDCILCTVSSDEFAPSELKMEYPVHGIHYGDIALRSLILAEPNKTQLPQPFRVYEITRPLSGTVTVYARHICHDLAGIPVAPFTASNVANALSGLKSNAVVECPFTFWTDKTTTADMTVLVPTPIWSVLGGSEGGILDIYGGDYEFDRFSVKLYKQRGQDSGVTIRYGKNLIDLRQEENCANVYTGVYAYWADTDGNVVCASRIADADGNYDYTRIMVLDLSEAFETKPAPLALWMEAMKYAQRNQIGVPRVNITVSHADLSETEEYKHLIELETVNLCDTVHVEFEALGVSATAKCIKTVYNTLLERYDSLEFGDAKRTIIDEIVSTSKTSSIGFGLLRPSVGGGSIEEVTP